MPFSECPDPECGTCADRVFWRRKGFRRNSGREKDTFGIEIVHAVSSKVRQRQCLRFHTVPLLSFPCTYCVCSSDMSGLVQIQNHHELLKRLRHRISPNNQPLFQSGRRLLGLADRDLPG